MLESFSPISKKWYFTAALSEQLRFGQPEQVKAHYWDELGISDPELKQAVGDEVKELLRIGHGWSWLLG